MFINYFAWIHFCLFYYIMQIGKAAENAEFHNPQSKYAIIVENVKFFLVQNLQNLKKIIP